MKHPLTAAKYLGVALLASGLTFGLTHSPATVAQSGAGLSGACAYLLTPQRWGWTPTVGQTYDSFEYGVIDFDARTIDGVITEVTPQAGDAEPQYGENDSEIKGLGFVAEAAQIRNTYKLRFVRNGVTGNDYIYLTATNSANTFLIADTRAGYTGVCQKL
jgi:hypothetical protein